MSVSLVTGFAGESHITSEQIARFNASVFGSGEYVTTGAGKTISAALQSANVVRVMPGDIMMKGRHVVIDSAQDLSIENGSQTLKRNDLIVCRYEKNASTGVETASLNVIKGTPGETAVDPSCISGDLLNGGALINEMPLFRISLDGLTVKDPVPLFSKYLLRGDQIADNAITTEKIANGTITANDLSNDFVSRITDLEAAWDSVSPLLCRRSLTSETKVVMGSSYSTFRADAHLEGYTPIAITRVGHTHPNALSLVCFEVSGDECRCLLANRTTAKQDSVHTAFNVVYARSRFVQ